jgi:CubicO group peptidase (beta-lactamase class C family)
MQKLQNIIDKHIENGLYPGVQWKITHQNSIYEGKSGFMNIGSQEPVCDNTLYRIWSMTKPIISVVILQLIEEKKIRLTDLLTDYLPEFGNLKVLKNRDSEITDLVDINSMPSIKDLLSHTAGFTYSFLGDAVGREYDRVKLFHSATSTLEEEINLLSSLPLLCQPSSQWVYSVSVDILGRIIEVVTTNNLQAEIKNRIFDPLEMSDTGFTISSENHDRIMTSYEFDPLQKKLTEPIPGSQKIGGLGYPTNQSTYARGGHGLFSTLGDYSKFAQMLLTGKNKLGKNILSQSILSKSTTNQLEPHYFPLEIKNIAETLEDNFMEPYGFGLGFRVMMNIAKVKGMGSIGEFGWGGAAATYFLVDPKNNLTAVLMTQVLGADNILNKDFFKEIYKNL